MRYRKVKRHYKYELAGHVQLPVGMRDTLKNVEPYQEWPFVAIYSGALIVQSKYAWDGPSGPTIDTENFMKASLVHDALYQLMREGSLDRSYRKRADEILREVCLREGMSKFRAWYVYHAVRMFGGSKVKPSKR